MTTQQDLQVGPTVPPASLLRRTLTQFTFFLREMARQPLSLAGLIIVIGFIIMAIIGPNIAPYDFDKLLVGPKNTAPSAEYLFGTDRLGRDVFSRVLWGARETVGLPAIATLLSVALGTTIGLASGYFGGWIDEIISRAVDILLAIPALVLAMVMLTTIVPLLNSMESAFVEDIGPERISLIIVIILLYTPIVTRVIRSATLGVRNAGFVEAAKLRGESLSYILFREILPSVLPTLAVESALRFSYAIFLVASLGFLGLGVQPPSPEWGRQVLDARGLTVYQQAPWSLWFPVAAIAVLIIGINLMADGLRRYFRYDNA